MIVANEQAHLKKILSDTIPLLCKSSLGLLGASFSVEALVGITVNEAEVFLISFKETVMPDGSTVSHSWRKAGHEDEALDCAYTDDSKNVNTEDRVSVDDDCTILPNSSDEVKSPAEVRVRNSPYEGNLGWQDEVNDKDDYSYQSASAASCEPLQTSIGGSQYRFGGEPEDWGGLRNSESFGKTEEFVAVKVEEEEIDEVDFEFPFGSKNIPEEIKDSEIRRLNKTHASLRRRQLGGSQRALHRTNLPFVPRRQMAKKQQNATSRSANNLGTLPQRMQPWRDDVVAPSKAGVKDSYSGMMGNLCRNIMQQSTATAEKQFICHICQARLSSPNNLMAHIQGTHLALDRYQCNLCLEKFRWYMQLHRHRKRCHAELYPPSDP